ncbi:MAG TPA: hypothetical protein VMU42_06795, partial [Candidatus Sulfotelmatobacter sp.]|nr:hypothetical protein [Candidatus Sulfotelmatobacter sp.]
DLETQVRNARLMRQADRAGQALTVETRSDRFQAVTELTLYTADHPGLFARAAGAMAVSGANIVDAKIFTTTDGMALDTFFLQGTDGKALDRPDRLARLSAAIEQTLSGSLKPHKMLAERKPTLVPRTDVFQVQRAVLIDNNASNTHTVIEVRGRDRPGFLYDVTYALFNLSLSISTARIATYGERAVDVFYVKDLFGLKVTQKNKLAAIEQRLLEALLPPWERGRAAPAAEGESEDKAARGRRRRGRGSRSASSAPAAE